MLLIVFAHPEAATVGITEAKAREKFSESGQCYHKQVELLFHSLTHEDEQAMIKVSGR